MANRCTFLGFGFWITGFSELMAVTILWSLRTCEQLTSSTRVWSDAKKRSKMLPPWVGSATSWQRPKLLTRSKNFSQTILHVCEQSVSGLVYCQARSAYVPVGWNPWEAWCYPFIFVPLSMLHLPHSYFSLSPRGGEKEQDLLSSCPCKGMYLAGLWWWKVIVRAISHGCGGQWIPMTGAFNAKHNIYNVVFSVLVT